MNEMTEEEYDSLDELWTDSTPMIKANGTGFISRQAFKSIGLDELSLDYLMVKAEATKSSPAHIIDELIREKLAASA